MASIRISQLAEVTSATSDDVFVINDGDINTRKITYSNLTQGLVPSVGDSTITGNLTISGLLTAGDLDIASGFLTVDQTNLRVGLGTTAPEQTLDVEGNIQIKSGNVFRFNDANNNYAVTLQAPILSANTVYAFPNALPSQDGLILSSTAGGVMSWATAFTDPLTTIGDLVVRDTTNSTTRLGIGGLGQVLTVQGDGTAQWANPVSGFSDPMTNAGDIILKDASNVTTRLGIGTANQVLTVNPTATALTWAPAQGGTVPTLNEVANSGATTQTDLSVGALFTVQGDGASQDGAIKLNCSQNSHGVTIQAPPHSAAAAYTLTLPDDAGTANQLLSTDGSGALSWVDNAPTLNAVLVALGVSSYVDNSAATTGGLSAGDVYYNTTDSKLTTVS